MPDDETERPSLEAPQLFSRRRAARKRAQPDDTTGDTGNDTEGTTDDATAVFDDTGTDVPVADDDAPTAQVRTGRRRRLETGEAADEPATPTSRRPQLSLPALTPPAAAAACGALAGLSLVAFVWVGFRGCEALRGTSSCGTAPGMLALTLIFVLAVVVGALLLRAFRLPEPGACSFLGVGVTAVIALVVLIDVLDHWSMALVIPAVSAATFLGSWWLTTTYIDPSAD